jgi:catechol 2,3-dioxygenase-like lactoylglutathione lyase family enzyme
MTFPVVLRIDAVTLATRDMGRAVDFYRRLGLRLAYGGEDAAFTSFGLLSGHLNLVLESQRHWSWWGRVILHVDDVDGLYRRALDQGIRPEFPPRDAAWGERYFHVVDPDGHEVSFATPLPRPS